MAHSINPTPNYKNWTRSRLIDRLELLDRRMDELGQAKSVSDDEIASLKRNETHFLEIQRIGQIGHWERSLHSNDGSYSDETCRILGYDPETYKPTYQGFIDRILPDDLEMVKAQVLESERNGTPFNLVYRIIRPDGKVRTHHSRSEILHDEFGRPNRIAGTVQDITEQVRAEETVKQSEAQFRLVTDNIPALISYIDPDQRIRFANQPCADWYGYSVDEFVGLHLRDILEKSEYEQNNPFTEKGLSGEISSNEEVRIRKDGSKAYLRLTRVPHIGDDGEVLGYFIIILDMTVHHEREIRLRQSQKMEAIGQLSGGIAHEFNNLLMVIVGNLEMAMDSVTDDAARKFSSTAMRGAMRGAELTSQLLAFSRKQDLRVEPMDLNSLVNGMREMLQRTLGETVSVESNLVDGAWSVLADRGLMENALLNLSLNARDAMSRGGRITITTLNQSVDDQLLSKHPDAAPGDYVMLEVADTGSGISPEDIDHVFEPFFTTKDVGEGTGLGLSMVHGFIEQSGGFVDIDSQTGKGTSVRVYLPRASDPDISVGAEAQTSAQVPSVVATVLVVEDDPGVREIVVGILSELGCSIIEVDNGKTALSALAENRDIDVLFTDVVLPGGLSGPDIADEARGMMPGLKIVFTSGYPDGEVNDLRYDDEKPWFIRKPYRRSELAELLVKVLQS